jgi:hypothetical protein
MVRRDDAIDDTDDHVHKPCFKSYTCLFCLTIAYISGLSHCKMRIYALFAQTIAYTFLPCLFAWSGVCWVGFDTC